MGFVITKEQLDKHFNLGLRKFIGARALGVMYETKPEIVKRLLPPPLEPTDSPGGLIFIAEYPKTNMGVGYKESALYIRCQYDGENGTYCLSMQITAESRMHNGRDVFGLPKKLADINVEKEGNKVHGWVERNGVRFVDIKAEMTGSLPALPPQGPTFLFKAMPRIDLTPGFDGPVLLCRQQTDVEMQSLEVGTAEVVFNESVDDPWHEIEITNVNAAFFLVSDTIMQPGKVLAEVDPEGFLPHYYKMTDFYYGD